MLLGIVFHSSISFVEMDISSAWMYKSPNTSLLFDVLIGVLHLFRIPVFFIISGYFIGLQFKKYGNLKTLQKRWYKIGIPFLCLSIFIIPYIGYFMTMLVEDLNFGTLRSLAYAHFGFEWTTAHLWFLYYLFLFNLIHYVYRQTTWGQSFKVGWRIHIIVVILLQFLLISYHGEETINGDYSLVPNIFSLLYFFSYYSLGVSLFNKKKNLTPKVPLWIMVVLSTFTVTTYLLVQYQHQHIAPIEHWNLVYTITLLPAIWTMILGVLKLFSTYFSKPKKWISNTIKSSYFIYVVHLPVIITLLYFSRHIILNPYILMPFLTISCYGICFFLHKIWRKTPMSQWLKV